MGQDYFVGGDQGYEVPLSPEGVAANKGVHRLLSGSRLGLLPYQNNSE